MEIPSVTRALMLQAAFLLPALNQQAAAQDAHHMRFRMPLVSAVRPLPAYAHTLQPLAAAFTQVAPSITNSDGFDLWPCFGYPPGPNLDCPTAGNPTVPLPFGGVILGVPAYVWSLKNPVAGSPGSGYGCDAYQNGTTGAFGADYKPCGQIATWYEDDSFDATDDLLQEITVKQGNTVIYDSGTIDYGPAGPSVAFPVEVILTADANFGIWPNAGFAPNNGNCSADLNYPLAKPGFPAGYYVVGRGKTCLPPVTGPAVFTTATILATPSYTQVTGAPCASKNIASPCYIVKWKQVHRIEQDFKIFLE